MSAVSNTRECFTDCIGKRVVGVLLDALPVANRGLALGTRTLVFEDGYGLTIKGNGSFWIDSPSEVKQAINRSLGELREAQDRLAGVVALADAATEREAA